MRAIWMAMLALCLWHQSAFAQGTAVPTDNELYAAYCVGALDEEMKGLRDTLILPSGQKANPTLEEMLQHQIAPLQQYRQRFAAYLASTGALINPALDVFGLMVATTRGREDLKQCVANMPQCSGTTSVKAWAECFMKFPACSRESRCQQPDALPF